MMLRFSSSVEQTKGRTHLSIFLVILRGDLYFVCWESFLPYLSVNRQARDK